MVHASQPSVEDVDFETTLATASRHSNMGEARFVVEEVNGGYEAKIKAPLAVSRGVSSAYRNSEEIEPRRAVRIDPKARTITIWPQVMYFSEHLYEQKYNYLSEIVVDLEYEYSPPKDHDGIAAILSNISSGFIKDPRSR